MGLTRSLLMVVRPPTPLQGPCNVEGSHLAPRSRIGLFVGLWVGLWGLGIRA